MRLSPDGQPVSRFRIAARHSDLARLQAYRVGQALQTKFPNAKIEYSFRASLGDLNQSDPLWKMPEKGVFTEDFLNDLKTGTADLVVHSWKDLPTQLREHTSIVATLPRADSRDLMLFRRDRLERGGNSALRVLTSSPRRAHNLEAFLKAHLPFKVESVNFESVRGNIPTRLKKLLLQDADALIVAKAALDRLLEAPEAEFAEVQSVIRDVLKQTRFMVLPLSVNPTAAAQGALAIEISNDRPDLREALGEIHCAETALCVEKERAILSGYGGGCHQKIGISLLKRPFGMVTFLKGLTDAGVVLDRVAIEGGVHATRAANSAACFPRAGESSVFFDRVELTGIAERGLGRALWVARETAWPAKFKTAADSVVWTAGVKTWSTLAARGVWVNGTADGLGEQESPAIDTLLNGSGQQPASWTKLTHSKSKQSSQMKVVATYELKPKSQAPDLTGRTHFYWMSGSSFDRAVELYPHILKSNHSCGPGLTHRHIAERLGKNAAVGVYLNLDSWRQAVTGTESP